MDSRLELLIGKEKIEQLKDTTILVLGLGGVGSYAVEALARCFVGTLILVDYDTVSLSNMNRQIIALHSNIGKKKTEVCKERILDINPNCHVMVYDLFYKEENKEVFFNQNIDFVIDACDTIQSKKTIIEECLKRKIPIISSMGTGNKLDPTKFEITDIRKTSYDPIAKILRKWVKDKKIKDKIPVVYSKEEPIKTTNHMIGSISFVPSCAGLLLTGYTIHTLLKKKENTNE